MTPRLVGCNGSAIDYRQYQETYRDIYELDPERVPDQVVGEDRCSLQAGIGPSVPIWVGNVQLGDRNGMDLVVGLGDGPLDRLFVFIGEYRRHGRDLRV